jgi:hypothetical protein
MAAPHRTHRGGVEAVEIVHLEGEGMRSIRRRGVPAMAALIGALALPAAAQAAAPTVTTGGVTDITPTTATLHGTIDPNGTATSYVFQLGTTRLYGTTTATTSAGGGNKAIKVAVAVGSLAPATTYHYRLVGLRGSKVYPGSDRTFKTKRQPLGVSLTATPNPIRAGGSTTLSGVLSGTGHAGRQVVLQANPWPYTAGWLNQGNPQVTRSDGSFAFPILSVPYTWQFRVVMVARPDVTSPIVVLGTTVKVTRHARVFRGVRRGRIHFWGRLKPDRDGALVLVQKLRRGNWITIAKTHARHGRSGKFSRYSKRVKQKHGGRYRIAMLDSTGLYAPSVSRSIRLHHLRF